MVEVKVRLTVIVPGAVMMSSQECDKNPKENYNLEKVVVEGYSKKHKKHYKEVISFRTRKSQPVQQCISISKEAYEYMISKDSYPACASFRARCPEFAWTKKMGKKARLEAHLQLMAEDLNGLGFSYEVMED